MEATGDQDNNVITVRSRKKGRREFGDNKYK
jgi:hypothetical protein